MTRVRQVLAATALAFVATMTLAPTAAADNCDIFINPEDCQNTGWTIGTIATVTGGVAVATVAVIAAQGQQTPTAPPAPQPPPVPPPPLTPQARPGGRTRRDQDDEDTIEGVAVRPSVPAPTVTAQPAGRSDHSFSLRLEIGRDPGTQTVQEAHDDPR